jgi:hypothetical protein
VQKAYIFVLLSADHHDTEEASRDIKWQTGTMIASISVKTIFCNHIYAVDYLVLQHVSITI